MVDAAKCLCNSSGVGDHTHGTVDLGKVTAGDGQRRLVVNTTLESGRAPIDKLDGALVLDGSYCGINILSFEKMYNNETGLT